MTASPAPRPRRRAGSRRRLGLAIGAVLAISLPLAAAGSGWRIVEITSDSMSPALRTGDRVVAAPVHGVPKVGDIVVFEPPTNWREAYPRWSDGGTTPERMVKRVVAVGGDTVICCAADGNLLVNDLRLDEPYLAERPGSGNTATYRIVVPKGSLWLLGDNRNASFDSSRVRAMTDDGSVPASAVTGRVIRRG